MNSTSRTDDNPRPELPGFGEPDGPTDRPSPTNGRALHPDPVAAVAEAPNPFDPSKYRLGTNYATMLGTTEHILGRSSSG